MISNTTKTGGSSELSNTKNKKNTQKLKYFFAAQSKMSPQGFGTQMEISFIIRLLTEQGQVRYQRTWHGHTPTAGLTPHATRKHGIMVFGVCDGCDVSS